MEDFGSGSGIGYRIRSIRKARGIKSTADLAALIPGGLTSGAVLRNIEAGVKTDLSVSQLLNIARALSVAPIFLLASIREPNSRLDIPNLSDDLKTMTAIEFDEWLSGTSDSIFEWTTPEDLSERNQLRAMRELELLIAERERLSQIINLAPSLEPDPDSAAPADNVELLRVRKADSVRQIQRLSHFLESAGWDVRRWR